MEVNKENLDINNSVENEEQTLTVYEIPNVPETFARIVHGYEHEPYKAAAHGIRNVVEFCEAALDPDSGLQPANFFQLIRDLAVLHLAAMNDVIEAKQNENKLSEKQDTSQ